MTLRPRAAIANSNSAQKSVGLQQTTQSVNSHMSALGREASQVISQRLFTCKAEHYSEHHSEVCQVEPAMAERSITATTYLSRRTLNDGMAVEQNIKYRQKHRSTCKVKKGDVSYVHAS